MRVADVSDGHPLSRLVAGAESGALLWDNSYPGNPQGPDGASGGASNATTARVTGIGRSFRPIRSLTSG
jgi:hypothetical protein